MSNDFKPFDGGFVSKNSGGSHITVDSNPGTIGTHITTDIGGLKQGGRIGVHIPVDKFGNVGQPDPFYKP